MQLTILNPQQRQSIEISWIEVETAIGNFVIQKYHVPTILTVLPHQPVTYQLTNGKQETFISPGGILQINRESATLLLNE
jgi:F0F1-type ATP synthase epsilon subunit